MKSKLTINEQIQHMKEKGITFKEVSEDDAKAFLSENNYYLKLSAYRTNYSKCSSGPRAGQYQRLDFGYLKELSTLDAYLRYEIIKMCLDIEHYLKVRLLKEIAAKPDEDGYEIVKRFLTETKLSPLNDIQKHKGGDYCSDLIAKYYPYFPAWVFVEVISFGQLLHLISFYENENGLTIVSSRLMNTVRDLRNAAAHSNCIMNTITKKIDATKQPDAEITNFVKGMPNISSNSRRNNLNYVFAYNLTTLIYIYNSTVPEIARNNRYNELKELMNGRMLKHKDYFTSNMKLSSTYQFFTKLLDNLNK